MNTTLYLAIRHWKVRRKPVYACCYWLNYYCGHSPMYWMRLIEVFCAGLNLSCGDRGFVLTETLHCNLLCCTYASALNGHFGNAVLN